jgi:hypothetical protein
VSSGWLRWYLRQMRPITTNETCARVFCLQDLSDLILCC